MPGSLASLMQPGGETAQPLPQQPSSAPAAAPGQAPPTLLSALLRGGPRLPPGGVPPGPAPGGGPQQQQQPAPNHAQTVATVRHLGEFLKHWKTLAADPGLGTRNIKGAIYDMMADVMGEGLVTLPQVMGELKGVPAEPLQQKQWVETHLKNSIAAMGAVLGHHAQAHPGVGPWPVEQIQVNAANQNEGHADMIGQVAGVYSRGRKR